ncbi:hypothetical protein ACJ41O_002878 [Fusarium nematophilum]
MHPTLLLLSALPTTWAAHAYAVPQGLALQEADAADGCTLPDAYHVRDFKGQTEDSGKTLSSLSFDFLDEDTKVTTPCHKNSSSKAILGRGSPRYACDNRVVEFIWDEENQKIWAMEKVCLAEDGTAQWEVSGSAHLPLKCARTGGCTTNTTDHRALFTSLNPVRQSPPS